MKNITQHRNTDNQNAEKNIENDDEHKKALKNFETHGNFENMKFKDSKNGTLHGLDLNWLKIVSVSNTLTHEILKSS